MRTDDTKMRVLVTGSDGLVGKSIIPSLSEEFDIVPYVELQWDICDRKESEQVIGSVRPDALLNLAAITNVDGCEDNEELAFRVNADGAGLLSEVCAVHGVHVISFSTDYVFDGEKREPYVEGDVTNPLSVYGRSKKLGEEKVLANNASSAILRTEWIYGNEGESFITKVVRAARQNGRAEVVNDQKGSPTYANDLAAPVAALIRQKARGIYHATNSGSCTWYDLARYVFSILKMDVPCSPIPTAQSARKAKRPSYSVLDCTRLKLQTGVEMRSWQEAVEDYLQKVQL